MAIVWGKGLVYLNEEEATVQSLKDQIQELLNSCIECAAANNKVSSRFWRVCRVEVHDSMFEAHRIVKATVECRGEQHTASFAVTPRPGGRYRWKFDTNSIERFIEAIENLYKPTEDLKESEIHTSILDGQAMLNLYFHDDCQDKMKNSGEFFDYVYDLVARVSVAVGSRLEEPENWCVPASVHVAQSPSLPEQFIVEFQNAEGTGFADTVCTYDPNFGWQSVGDTQLLENCVVVYIVHAIKKMRLCGLRV